jgi:CheY-like chemotaxis protein
MADSVAAGLALFQGSHFDILLCDIAMPVEDGFAFVRKVRSLGDAHGGDTPAMALTALAGDEERSRALAEGFQLYLVKPVDIEHLTEAVATVLDGGRAIRAPESRRDHPITC